MQGISSGFFNHAHHFTINNPTMIDVNYDSHSMDLLARHTIPGAEFDSSARDPPPRCHPGTRLDLSILLQTWIRDVARHKNFAWLYGPAGVGKSAILQTLAEELCEEVYSDSGMDVLLGATLFFSRGSKRDDAQRVVLTLAYQLAVKFPSYRKYVVDLLNKDPKFVEKSFGEQFKRFIVKPFAKKGSLTGFEVGTIVIILDGLDECAGEWAQREIVLSIGGFVQQYPESPLVWIISSRPEPYIRAAFDSRAVSSAWMRVEVPVNSTQACLDVERYLRFEFDSIREKYPLVFDLDEGEQWPPETQFVKVAKSSSGLFLFATVAARYIDDVNYGNPISQLKQVIDAIDSVPQADDDLSTVATPFAALDALYTQILSQIPASVFPMTKRILGCITKPYPTLGFSSFSKTCNWLGMPQADAYGSLQKLHAVVGIPRPEERERGIQAFHVSFIDYLIAPARSGSFYLDPLGVKNEQFRAAARVLDETHHTENGDIVVSRIGLSWPAKTHEDTYRFEIFLNAFQLLLLAEPDVLDGTVWSVSSHRASFFRNLDIAEVISSSTGGSDESYISQWLALWPLLTSIHTSPTLYRLEEDKMFKYIPISTLDPKYLDLTKTYIFRNANSIKVWDTIESQDEERSAVLTLLKKFGPVVLPNDAWMVIPRCRDSEWKSSLRNNITSNMKETPSQLAVVYGQGHKASVLMRLVLPDAEWLVFSSYIASSN